MPTSYAAYLDATVNAFIQSARPQELINKKVEILTDIATHYNTTPTSILYVGFSPWILNSPVSDISITELTPAAKKLLDTYNVKYTYIEDKDLSTHSKEFQWVVAGDEYLTFASSETEQRNKIKFLSDLAGDLIITTLRDYKNQDFKDREFGHPVAIRNSSNTTIFLEHNEYDFNERNSWETKVYQIQNNVCTTHGPVNRCSMYFKQLAKFSIDAGALKFLVHKNLMYKSLIKKNYEHVISIIVK